MTLLAVPNVSEGRDRAVIEELLAATTQHGARVMDVHIDPDHGRSVFTVTGEQDELVNGMAALAVAATRIDLTNHAGVHPRLGGLDVCPFVPHETAMSVAIDAAHATGTRVGSMGLPVYYYGAAARRRETRELPEIRRGGSTALIARAREGFSPDEGPLEIDPATGVVCIGARGYLIAFNVWLDCDIEAARRIAAKVRSTGDGPPGVRALAFDITSNALRQISMNLMDPSTTGIDDVYEMIATEARREGTEPVSTEIVGLVPERFLPKPNAEAARLLLQPDRSLEAALRS